MWSSSGVGSVSQSLFSLRSKLSWRRTLATCESSWGSLVSLEWLCTLLSRQKLDESSKCSLLMSNLKCHLEWFGFHCLIQTGLKRSRGKWEIISTWEPLLCCILIACIMQFKTNHFGREVPWKHCLWTLPFNYTIVFLKMLLSLINFVLGTM